MGPIPPATQLSEMGVIRQLDAEQSNFRIVRYPTAIILLGRLVSPRSWLAVACPQTNCWLELPSDLGDGERTDPLPRRRQARVERKNRPDVTIRGIWFARRSKQDAAGCLN